ncbi:hypothetical protein Tco_0940004 [Tanacetum coccineum]|uniref:Reverse transcriptase domain-containing protein n=1 Tax=Tanacetum coccineum TaxID=301880 RepID=A0ABQ5DSV2_9ASTR
MYKLDPVTLAPKDKNNRETHIYYLKHTIKQAAILREIVEQAKSLNPLDSVSYSAYKYVKLIQELLGYVRDTCPNIHKPSEKLVAVMPINKKKTVRFAEPVISSSTSQKQLGSFQTKTKQTSNKSVSTSTRVSRSTKSSRSKSTDNTKNDRILQISSSTQKKNKVEDHSRIVKIANLEQIIEDIQAHHQADKESLLNAIYELKNSQEGPSDTRLDTTLEAQAANMANTNNTTIPSPVARKGSYKEFMSCQPINFKGSKGAVGLIRWFEQTESMFSRSNYTEDCKVKFAIEELSTTTTTITTTTATIITNHNRTEDKETFRSYAVTPTENNRGKGIRQISAENLHNKCPGRAYMLKGYEFSPRPDIVPPGSFPSKPTSS